MNLYESATSIKRQEPPFSRPKESSAIVVTSIKRPSTAWYT